MVTPSSMKVNTGKFSVPLVAFLNLVFTCLPGGFTSPKATTHKMINVKDGRIVVVVGYFLHELVVEYN